MTIAIVAALAENRVIGRKGRLPWHLPEDMRRFKRLTEGHAVIMGRLTYISLPARFRPLPRRLNIVLGQKREGMASSPSVFFAKQWEEAIRYAKERQYGKIFVVGGEKVYKKALWEAEEMYLTHVQTSIEDGDAFFPAFDLRQWRKESVESYDKDDYPVEFVHYHRKR